MVRGLDVAAPVAEVRHEIDLEAFAVRHTFAGAAPVDHAHIDVVVTCSQLVVHDVLHDVRLLDLAEPQSCVAQPHVLEIVFLRAADVLASLDVEPSRLLDDERVLEMADVLHDGVRADAGMQHAGERGLDLGRIGQSSDGGGQHVDQVVELLRPAQPVARDDVLEIGLLEQVLQIEGLLLVASHGQGERHAAEHHVFGPAVLDVAVVRLHELGERQGADADLVAAAAELGHHVGGQHLRVAARHVHVHVAHAQQPVEHPVQTGRLLAAHLLVRDRVLHLVQQHVVRFLAIRDTGSHIVVQGERVAVALVHQIVQRDLDDVVVVHALRAQMVLEQVEQEIGLAAAPRARDDLDHTVAFARDEIVQVLIPGDAHRILRSMSCSHAAIAWI